MFARLDPESVLFDSSTQLLDIGATMSTQALLPAPEGDAVAARVRLLAEVVR
ncbi:MULTISPECIES: hypothetical protein [Rhodococcus]|jgi:hypothetical protein|uniref:Uncharacterized protein n=1 Tax=Rhodococcus cerastii TaxID=908616 RepID=A0ABU4D5B0_9NOCA|nr:MULTISPECIES: hypothetical protein [Rhodococcus]MDV6304913.1 hypothetical protein [Rhodococcus cerastii]MDV7989344.1 hypothetical protein [Rhodococcus sp. IEGM 1374]